MSLGGGVNLSREPRNGRTFEYQGEDPLLAGTLAKLGFKWIEVGHGLVGACFELGAEGGVGAGERAGRAGAEERDGAARGARSMGRVRAV